MDDMRNTSAPLYGKAEPATTKTTMSVREMRQLLGLGKTDSYWLLHKNLFEVILINDKRRIVISSFEKWYAHRAGCRVGACDRQPQCRKIHPVLCRRVPFALEGRADCCLFR